MRLLRLGCGCGSISGGNCTTKGVVQDIITGFSPGAPGATLMLGYIDCLVLSLVSKIGQRIRKNVDEKDVE
jgi:hypothetical protein